MMSGIADTIYIIVLFTDSKRVCCLRVPAGKPLHSHLFEQIKQWGGATGKGLTIDLQDGSHCELSFATCPPTSLFADTHRQQCASAAYSQKGPDIAVEY